MLHLLPNHTYRIYYADGTTMDFLTPGELPLAKHLIEVKTKTHDSVRVFELLSENKFIEIAEIDKSIADL